MKLILILILGLTLNACSKPSGSSEAGALSPAPSQPVNDPGLVVTPPAPQPQPTPTPDPGTPVDPEYAFIESGTYSPQQKWCVNDVCDQDSVTPACVTLGPQVFSDFTLNKEMLYGYFFNSTPENISLDEQNRTMTLIAAVTGHEGLIAGYKYLRGTNQWIIDYGGGCARLYDLVGP